MRHSSASSNRVSRSCGSRPPQPWATASWLRPTMSVHEHNEHAAAQKLIDVLAQGKRVALVTDAGTPAVSDPGAKAVKLVREAGFSVSPVPGPSAVIAALSASGLQSYSFAFAGFVPPNAKARREALKKLRATKPLYFMRRRTGCGSFCLTWRRLLMISGWWLLPAS